jgi:hypothetical protein
MDGDGGRILVKLSVTEEVPAETLQLLDDVPYLRTLIAMAARGLVGSGHSTVTLAFDSTTVFQLTKPGPGRLPESVADDFLNSLELNDDTGLEDEVYDHEMHPHEGAPMDDPVGLDVGVGGAGAEGGAGEGEDGGAVGGMDSDPDSDPGSDPDLDLTPK